METVREERNGEEKRKTSETNKEERDKWGRKRKRESILFLLYD